MPSWTEARAAVIGMKLLLRFEAGFVQWFDRSHAGALRSFYLMIPVFPLFLYLRFGEFGVSPDATAFRVVSLTLINYALSWIMFPLILIVLGRAIEREGQAIAAIACYNWVNFAWAILACLLTFAGSAGLLGDWSETASTLLVLASLIYEAYMLRVLLGIGYGGAILLAVVDYLLMWSLFILLMSPVIYLPSS
ncbi:MAG: hypothetical protein IPK59_16110 [Rhodospirillaceae bacterium]|nr:hypothetical protein [Rhodospirillaceae bacterium]